MFRMAFTAVNRDAVFVCSFCVLVHDACVRDGVLGGRLAVRPGGTGEGAENGGTRRGRSSRPLYRSLAK